MPMKFRVDWKIFILSCITGLLIILTVNGKTMENTYFTWDEFAGNFGSEITSSKAVYNNMLKNGLVQYSLLKFDCHFISDRKQNLDALMEFLEGSYPYTFKETYRRDDELWELTGMTNEIPVTADNLMYWALDMYKRGYEFDAYLDGYGAPSDKDNQTTPIFSKEKEDEYFDKGLDSYNTGNLSGAIFEWTNALQVNPNEPNALYSRAIVKNELYTWKAALRDYDKAIEAAPKFVSAILNRGSLKDDNGDHKGAIEDYDIVIGLNPTDIESLRKAYFNRGNSYLQLGVSDKYCHDWKMAKELGATYADERLNDHCK